MSQVHNYSSRWDLALDAPEISHQFEEFIDGIDSATIFNSMEWLICYRQFLLDKEQSQITLSVWHENTLKALVPLVIGRESIYGIKLRVLRLLGDPLADRCPLLVKSEHGLLAAVMYAIKQSPETWDLAIFSEQPDGLDQNRIIDNWLSNNRVSNQWQLSAEVPVLEINPATTERDCTKSLKTRIRRSKNRIEKAGVMSIQHWIVEPSQVESLLLMVSRIENLSWKGQQGVGIFSGDRKREFFACLSHKLAQRNRLFISVLNLDGQAISYRYGFVFRNRFLDYNLAFLPEFSKLGAGRVLLADIINHAIQSGWSSVDASRASLKTGHMLSAWPVQHLMHYRLWIFNAGLKARLLGLIVLRVKPVFNLIRQPGLLKSK